MKSGRGTSGAERLGLAGGMLVLPLVGCSLLFGTSGISGGEPRDASLDTVVGDDANDAGDLGTAEGGPCAILVASDGGDVCATIAAFRGAQTVDGVGDEFCQIPATLFAVATGEAPQPVDGGAGVDAVLSLRVGWSSTAIHLHVHVDERAVVSAAPDADVYNGDAVEVFLSPIETRTGTFGADADVGVHFAVSSPSSSSSAPARWGAYLWDGVSPAPVSTPPDGGDIASRLVDGGYEVEMRLPWTWIAAIAQHAPTAPGAGSVIGLDFSADVSDGVSQRIFQSSLRAASPAAACPVGASAPWCDDRIWCSPVLAPTP